MTIFSDFKYYLDYCLSGNTDPVPDILRIEDCFNCLSNQQCTIPKLIKEMILPYSLNSVALLRYIYRGTMKLAISNLQL